MPKRDERYGKSTRRNILDLEIVENVMAVGNALRNKKRQSPYCGAGVQDSFYL